MTKAELQSSRPLSPHLSVYRLIPTMVMSILHRITGGVLYVGAVLFAWWLFAAATNPAYFDWVNSLFSSWFGRLVLFGFTWALMHHLAGGVRHLFWDTGRGFHKQTSTRLAWLTLASSIVLTTLVWVIAYSVR